MTNWLKQKYIFAGTLFLVMNGTVFSQNLSSLLDAIHNVETKLTELISKERSAREKADEQIRSSIPKTPSKKVIIAPPVDSTLIKGIKALSAKVDSLSLDNNQLSGNLTEIENRLTEIQNMETDSNADEKITALATSLMDLICQLKSVLATGISDEEKPAMELGGVVTLDAAIEPESWRETATEIGDMELSAVVNVSDGLAAAITIKAEERLSNLFVDQALVEWNINEPFTMILGQQTFNHALLSSHLISDPLIKDEIETVGPGLTSLYSSGTITFGTGVTFIPAVINSERMFQLNFSDTSVTESERSVTESENMYLGITHIDYSFADESVARLSAAYSDKSVSIAAGTGWVVGTFSMDGEFSGTITTADEPRPAGYYIGLAYTLPMDLELALRYDGYSSDAFADITHRIGFGSTFSFGSGLFMSMEYGLTSDPTGETSHEIALKGGLESTIELPGFQRRTIIRN